MAVKPALTNTPQRTTPQFTTGDPDLTLKVASSATAPNAGSLFNNPRTTTLLGTDVNSVTIAIPAQSAGATYAFSSIIPFGELPVPLVVGISDIATFIVGLQGCSHGIAGLALGGIDLRPVAYTRGSAPASLTNILQSSQIYTGWAAQVSGTLVAVSATAAGSLIVRAHGVLYDVLG